MQLSFGKIVGAVILVACAIAVGVSVYIHSLPKSIEAPVATTVEVPKSPEHHVIGTSVEGRTIEEYTYGTGAKHLLFVGGMHGGYEWNSVLLAYQLIDYLNTQPSALSSDFSISIIPALNPDGVFAVTGKQGRFAQSDVSLDETVRAAGRFNAHKVDLNRNFDCKWQPKSTWQSKEVSAGTAAFSEPESQALKTYVDAFKPAAVIFWHSKSNAVYASKCNDGILPQTLDIMNAYSKAAGYPAVKSFDAYPITGDSEGWLASVGIPAITVELSSHESIEWEKNIAGVQAVFQYYAHGI